MSHCTRQHRERGKTKEGKGSLHSRWSRDGQESVGVLSFSLWAEHHCILRGGGMSSERPDGTGQGPDDIGQGPDDTGQGPDDKGQGPDDTGQGPNEVSTG